MTEIKIGKKYIGASQPPYFIADIAANHDGDINRAYRLIELAKKSGADAAKFQNFKADTIVSDYGFKNLSGQLSHQKSWEKSVYEVYEVASLPDQWTTLLKKKCDDIGIEYMTSPYDFHSVDFVNDYVNCYKIGSGDISWHDILIYIAKKGKPVMLATGASTMDEVKRAVQIISAHNKNLVLMQCNTNYTANAENFKCINLNVLKTYSQQFPDTILGLSDHTKGFSTVLGAIALGARVIEKHFTDDDTRIGPDHKFSTTPVEWSCMVKASHELYKALGDGIKKIEENEQQTSIIQKRGLYLNQNVNKGELIKPDCLIPLRPRSDSGFEPYESDLVIGKQAKVDLIKDTMLKRSDVIL